MICGRAANKENPLAPHDRLMNENRKSYRGSDTARKGYLVEAIVNTKSSTFRDLRIAARMNLGTAPTYCELSQSSIN